MITVDAFFELFLTELQGNKELWAHYKFLTDSKRLPFRKAYFCQRLQYIMDHIGPKEQAVWDCGCGYGTTAIFLALNGYRVRGTTLEFYFREIEKRKQYWSPYGDVSRFDPVYEDLYDTEYYQQFDTIILQDTLHHLEPVEKAFSLLNRALKPGGRLLVVEENGQNLVQNLKLLKQRGFRKKKQWFDETLQKQVAFGDENIRSLRQWIRLLQGGGFRFVPASREYIRFLPPWFFQRGEYTDMIRNEKQWSRYSLLANFFYFGISFQANKETETEWRNSEKQ